ncbi:probable cytochrome P450 305a1 [Lutzomyia longipalpis]|uniref:probable cytochrome P450 305a1 n=1 Tax=Lutzomyia longipalpis TaxID=7200 RepID=UPI0024845272|nr:probable cytochrome P450 305a1 [Lutzomyia longipalpis]
MSLIIFCLIVSVLIVFGLLLYYSQKRPKDFPPGPQWYPIVGNSLQLRRTAMKLGDTLRVYEKWSRDFNSPDVVGFRLGRQLFITGLSAKAVYDIHKMAVFDGRPKDFFTSIRTLKTYGGITFTDENLWKEHKNFTLKRLKNLGVGSNRMQELIEKELLGFKQTIEKKMAAEGSLWPGPLLKGPITNVIWTLVAGDAAEHIVLWKTLTKLLDQRVKNFDLSDGALSDFPWLRFVAPEYFGYNLLCHINNELQAILRRIIKDHHGSYTENRADDDFIYAFIREMKNQASNKDSTFTDRQLMVVMLDFVIGGTYETSGTFDLALMTLALREDIQEEIYAEIARTPRENLLTYTHRADLPLSQAFIMEIGRFYNIAPLGGPRRVLEDTHLCGYRIPKDTTVLIGSEFVHKNQNLWGDPHVFRPSRFLDETRRKLIYPEYFYQFGQGRRMCMGITLAKAFLHTFLTGIVHDYKISVPPGKEPPSQVLIPGMFRSIQPYSVQFTKRI